MYGSVDTMYNMSTFTKVQKKKKIIMSRFELTKQVAVDPVGQLKLS